MEAGWTKSAFEVLVESERTVQTAEVLLRARSIMAADLSARTSTPLSPQEQAALDQLLRSGGPEAGGQETTVTEILEAIASAHPVIEVLESAFVVPEEAAHLAMVADLQMNGGFVHGPAVRDWQTIDIANEHLEIVIDGVVRWDGVGKNTNGPDLLRLLDYLVNEGQFRTGGLQVGQWITTGSWMGKLLAHGRSAVEVRFANFGGVAFSFGK